VKSVSCFGALHWDVKACLTEPMRAATSNPVTTTRTVGGVATNVARSLARLGVPVRIISVVGEGAGPLLDTLGSEGIDVSGVEVVPGVGTASYTAVLAPDGSLEAGLADMAVYDRMDRSWGLQRSHAGDLWFADTNIPAEGLEALHAASAGRPWFVDPVSVAKSRRVGGSVAGAACVFPDALEATAMTGKEDPESAAIALREQGVDHVVVTLGPDGVVHAGPDGVERRGALVPETIVDVTGAGDALAAGYLAALALEGDDPVGWGLAAASLAVETIETVPEHLGLPALLARL
jgi:pseudouridine kinase